MIEKVPTKMDPQFAAIVRAERAKLDPSDEWNNLFGWGVRDLLLKQSKEELQDYGERLNAWEATHRHEPAS